MSRPPAVVGTAAALMGATVASGLLTFGFWVVAARWFPAATVGQVSALAASAALLAALAQLNLANLYARFLPTAGPRATSLLRRGYGATVLAGLGLSAGFLALAGASGFRAPGPVVGVLFTGVVVGSAIFSLQSSVLAALGRAAWAPLVSGLTAAARLALLPALAGLGAATGLLAAWTVPVVGCAVVVSWWVLTRLAPAHGRRGPAPPAAPRRELVGFVSAEYVNGLLGAAVAFLPPVLVTATLGAERGAYFYLPWLVGVSATTLLWNVVTSFVVAAAHDQGRLRAHLHRAGILMLLVVGVTALVAVVAAEPILALLGPEYAAQGATALRLVGLSVPFTAVWLLFAAFCMLAKRMWRVVAVQSAGTAVIFGGLLLGLPSAGVVAPAAALLVSQAGMAVALLPTLLRSYRATGEARLVREPALEPT